MATRVQRGNKGFVGNNLEAFSHRIGLTDSGTTRITYAISVDGLGAEEFGSAVSSDFPRVLRALAALAESREAG